MSNFIEQLEQAIQCHLNDHLEEAYQLYQSLLRQDSEQSLLLHWSGVLDFQLHRFELALEKLNKALQSLPQDFLYFCHNSLGNVHASYSQYPQAKYHYEQAIKLKPDFGSAYSNLGRVLRCLDEPLKALKVYQDALKVKHIAPDVFFNIANIFHEQQELLLAETFYIKSLQLNSKYSEAHYFLSLVKAFQGDDARAQYHMKQAYQQNLMTPVTSSEHEILLDTLDYHCEQIKTASFPLQLKAYSRLLIASYTFNGLSNKKRFSLFKNWDNLHQYPVHFIKSTFKRSKKIRVGYISPDFSDVSPAKVILPLFKNHHADFFDIYAYSDVTFQDQITEHFKKFSHHWRDTHLLNDEQVIEQIKSDQIDILVDLAGHTRRNRLGVFARRSAPIQVTGLGFASTTGLKQMDFCFSDTYLTPPEIVRYHSEKLIYLTTSLCWLPPEFKVPLATPPCLKHPEHIIFGCANHLSKLNDEVIAVWAEILKRVPHAYLYLKAEDFNEPHARFLYRYRFAQYGIKADRLVFFGKTTYPKHLKFYNKIDIALDPFPYQGGITSCDTLWMGVPLVSLGVKGRLGASILKLINKDELIADTKPDYINKAIELALKPQLIGQMKHSLRDDLLNSPLCKGQQFAREIEAAYSMMVLTGRS